MLLETPVDSALGWGEMREDRSRRVRPPPGINGGYNAFLVELSGLNGEGCSMLSDNSGRDARP